MRFLNVLISLIFFLADSSSLLAQTKQQERTCLKSGGEISVFHGNSCFCKDKSFEKFLNPRSVASPIKTCSESLVRLCSFPDPKNTLYACNTYFSLGNGLFLTNLHALFAGEPKFVKLAMANPDKFFKSRYMYMPTKEGFKKVTVKVVNRPDKLPADLEETNNHSWDLVRVQIEELRDIPGIEMSSAPPRIGDELFHMGFELVQEISNLDPKISRGPLLSISEPSYIGGFYGANGTSGGPVVNRDCKLIGVFWGKLPEGVSSNWDCSQLKSHTSYFIPIAEVKKFLKITDEANQKSLSPAVR
jgi:hypothetical protein